MRFDAAQGKRMFNKRLMVRVCGSKHLPGFTALDKKRAANARLSGV